MAAMEKPTMIRLRVSAPSQIRRQNDANALEDDMLFP
jgi:hypothetical protein